MKRLVAIIMSIVILVPVMNVHALVDEYILNDEIINTYTGRAEGSSIIDNMKFSDINGHWAQEAIVRGGALNLVKGYGKTYSPNDVVTNAEAIAFVLRAIDRENEAVTLGKSMQVDAPEDSALRSVWSLGYLNIANQLGLITPQEYTSLTAQDQTNVDFKRNSPATRERVADWIVKAIRTVDADSLKKNNSIQKILSYSDYDNISAGYAESVEILTQNNIINGDETGKFNPKKGITRAEIAQVLKNIDRQYFEAMEYEKKTGTVSTMNDNRYKTTGREDVWRNIYVRTSDGTVDVLQYDKQSDNISSKNQDAVVFKNGTVAGLATLEDGDEIEYIVDSNSDEVLYVYCVKGLEKVKVNAFFYSVNASEGSINVKDSKGNHLIYSMIDGLIVQEDDGQYLRMDLKKQRIDRLPNGSILKLELANNIVTKIEYIGEPQVSNEIRGIVIENNSDFGYIAIINNKGEEVAKYYYEDDLRVKKQQHYDINDDIGYIDEVFSDFRYNPRESEISQIEPGDIVFLKMSQDEPDTIASISASTDYIMKYGKIKQISFNDDYMSLHMEYENKQTGWYDMADDIFVSLDGKPISSSDIKIGDWAKLLVNQAPLAPGHVMESVKEIAVEGNEHFISGVLKGNLSGINDVQNQLLIKNSYTLTKTGWNDYQNLTTYSLAGKDIEYYHNDKRISLDYAKQYFKRSDATVYVALENNYTGDKVKKVTFRLERDEALSPDTIMYSSGDGTFSILSQASNINADKGTIVRRHGRLVDAQDIMSADYAHVVLNGNGKAAVVDIVDAPTNSGIMIARGRIQSVDEGKSFKVQSMSVLSGNVWSYTPVQREFAIDHDTLFIGPDGVEDSSTFIDYTSENVIDNVYNIVVDGTRATHVFQSPYCTKAVKGEIYKIEGDLVYLKKAFYYESDSGKWKAVSKTDTTISVAMLTETIIAKNNKIVPSSALGVGDQIKVMVSDLPQQISAGMQVDGFIVTVEN